MGYWTIDADSYSPIDESGKSTWGDIPADAVGEALEKIFVAFERDVGRLPTEAECVTGLKFSLIPALKTAREKSGREL